jgi:lipopolysaccharide/colanic/teichoic acid biosynthesis glycosyltransferase
VFYLTTDGKIGGQILPFAGHRRAYVRGRRQAARADQGPVLRRKRRPGIAGWAQVDNPLPTPMLSSAAYFIAPSQ